MKQALHIFAKDTRGLWLQIPIVGMLFAIYSAMPPNNSGFAVTSLLDWGNIPSLLIVIACWILGASVVHEDAPAAGNALWITRPYSRMSMVTAKVLFLLVFILLPLLISGGVLEARAGVNIATNIDGLLTLEIQRSLWLILPGLMVGAVTRSLTEFAGVLCALAMGLAFCETIATRRPVDLLSITHTLSGPIVAGLVPLIVAAVVVMGLQYAARKTLWSRWVLGAAAIGSGFLMPLSGVAVLSTEAKNSEFDAGRMRIAFDETQPVRLLPHVNVAWEGMCLDMTVQVDGLPAGNILRAFGKPAGDVTDRMGIRTISVTAFEETNGGYQETVCFPAQGILGGPGTTLRVSLNLAVVAVSEIAKIPARRGSFVAGNVGSCEILTPFPENTQLRCDLAEPLTGSIGAGLEYEGYKLFSEDFGRHGPFRLSPVSRMRFDGESAEHPGGWTFEEAFGRSDAYFVLRRERVVGTVQRDLVYHDVIFPWTARLAVRK